MRVLTLSNCELDPSLGSGKARLRWIDGLRSSGFTVDTLEPAQLVDGVTQVPLGNRFRLALGALRNVRLDDVQLLECYGAEFGWFCRKFFPRRNRPLIVAHTDGMELHQGYCMNNCLGKDRTHSSISSFVSRPIHRWLERCAFSSADAMVSGSPGDVRYARSKGLFGDNSALSIGLGVDDAFLGLEFNPVCDHEVVYVGTWTSRKAPERMVRVMCDVLRKDQGARFNILGASDSEERIRSMFPASLQARLIVQPKLSVPSMIEQIRRAKVKILLSHYEGFGMATTEAMGCGCAVVVTPTGFGDALQDGFDGVVCDFFDEARMVSEITNLLSDDARRVTVARNGWQKVQDMTWSRQTELLTVTYKTWLSAWSRADAAFRV